MFLNSFSKPCLTPVSYLQPRALICDHLYSVKLAAAARTSPHLVDFDALPDDIKEYDRQAVRSIPRLVSLIGQEIKRQ